MPPLGEARKDQMVKDLQPMAPDRLIRALQEARADDTGVVLTAAGPEDLARLVAHIGRGTAPAPRTPGDRVRLLARLTASSRESGGGRG